MSPSTTLSTIRRHRAAMQAALAVALVLGTRALALASDPHGGDGGHHRPDLAAWMTLLFSFVNFSIFLYLIRRFAWPAARDYLATRHREVADAMAVAEQARAEAEAIRAEFAEKEAALEETRRHMLEELRLGAQADREKLIEDARNAAERLRAEAERQAEFDLARARRELRVEAARLAAELAEKEVQARLTEADRSRLVREFVEGVRS